MLILLEPIPWDKDAVYEYYEAKGWTKDQIDGIVFSTQSASTTDFTDFDTAVFQSLHLLQTANPQLGTSSSLSRTNISSQSYLQDNDVVVAIVTTTTR
jgi:hypothetical protein